jgi:hypothetical protein
MYCKIIITSSTKINFLIMICSNIIFSIWFIRFIGVIFDHIYYNNFLISLFVLITCDKIFLEN